LRRSPRLTIRAKFTMQVSFLVVQSVGAPRARAELGRSLLHSGELSPWRNSTIGGL
jgi:hypothetical protein